MADLAGADANTVTLNTPDDQDANVSSYDQDVQQTATEEEHRKKSDGVFGTWSFSELVKILYKQIVQDRGESHNRK
jgi:hypothetical protein